MQEWYQNTTNTPVEQTVTLQQFLLENGVQLPQLTQDIAEHLDAEFTVADIHWSLQNAKENTAPGPTGQTINLYKLIFLEAPDILTAAINQIAFTPGLLDTPEFNWIRQRKIVPGIHTQKRQPH